MYFYINKHLITYLYLNQVIGKTPKTLPLTISYLKRQNIQQYDLFFNPVALFINTFHKLLKPLFLYSYVKFVILLS